MNKTILKRGKEYTMTSFKLSNPDAVYRWFNDPCFDLFDLAQSEAEREYLKKIQEIVERTGAPNIVLAQYILNLENRLEQIEKAVTSSQ
jgi:hypothetical protein